MHPDSRIFRYLYNIFSSVLKAGGIHSCLVTSCSQKALVLMVPDAQVWVLTSRRTWWWPSTRWERSFLRTSTHGHPAAPAQTGLWGSASAPPAEPSPPCPTGRSAARSWWTAPPMSSPTPAEESLWCSQVQMHFSPFQPEVPSSFIAYQFALANNSCSHKIQGIDVCLQNHHWLCTRGLHGL